MTLLFVCECCDAVAGQLHLPGFIPTGGGLTGSARQDIITVNTVCDDCRETIFAGYDKTFYSQPVIN
ncbi:hypothetical protein L7E55_04965 [Pelotomaculum isophthalicicum JI]|uniref:Uncharacterized protein n=1 Tax=Pelotomaculum isophthalicicum JI TaxID=947010 RepID=A0A9X4GYD7_9FIRM|nr:hypothetical protein [Pelotomaculum isophthalicicum]MDF9407715.1 hypothetical protein [Pelotomaculum isophthalicicum JI]